MALGLLRLRHHRERDHEPLGVQPVSSALAGLRVDDEWKFLSSVFVAGDPGYMPRSPSLLPCRALVSGLGAPGGLPRSKAPQFDRQNPLGQDARGDGHVDAQGDGRHGRRSDERGDHFDRDRGAFIANKARSVTSKFDESRPGS